MSNPTTGELVLRKIWSEDDQAIRTVPASNTSFSIELSQADGDSVITHPYSILINNTTESTCVGIKTVVLYLEADGAGTAQAKIQISPVDSGNAWMDVATSTVTANASALTASAVFTICARRIRVVNVNGTPTVHLVGQAI